MACLLSGLQQLDYSSLIGPEWPAGIDGDLVPDALHPVGNLVASKSGESVADLEVQKVDQLVGKLIQKFPEKTRYTKQQLNFWRDFSWHLTIGHGRDWLAIHNTSPETWEGVQSFQEKRNPDYDEIRRQWREDDSPEWVNRGK